MTTNRILSAFMFLIFINATSVAPAKMPEQANETSGVAEFEKNMGITQNGAATVDDLNSHRTSLGQFNSYRPTYFQGLAESGWNAKTRFDVDRFSNTNPAVVSSQSTHIEATSDNESNSNLKDDHQ